MIKFDEKNQTSGLKVMEANVSEAHSFLTFSFDVMASYVDIVITIEPLFDGFYIRINLFLPQLSNINKIT